MKVVKLISRDIVDMHKVPCRTTEDKTKVRNCTLDQTPHASAL